MYQIDDEIIVQDISLDFKSLGIKLTIDSL